MKKLRRTLISILIVSQAFASSETIYVVQSGDTLSTIAQTHIGPPVYPKKTGSLAKLKRLNPWLGQKDLIFPGQVLRLEKSETEIASKTKQESRAPATSTEQAKPTAAEPMRENPTPPLAVDHEIPHSLLMSMDYGVTTLSATDGFGNKAQLFSNYDVTAKAAWRQEWTSRFSTALGINLRAIAFDPSTNPEKSLSRSSQFMTGLSLTSESKLSQRFALQYGIFYQPELFLHGANTSVITIDSISVPSLSVGGTAELFSVGKTSVGLKGDYTYLFSASSDSYSVDRGQTYQGLFFLRRKYGMDHFVEAALGYRYRTQNTSVVELNESSVFGRLIFSIPLFQGN